MTSRWTGTAVVVLGIAMQIPGLYLWGAVVILAGTFLLWRRP